METNGSLPRSQGPATCPYAKPDQTSPTESFKIQFIIILSSRLRSSKRSLYFRFPHQNTVRISAQPTGQSFWALAINFN
jgi:hypothetical protein